MDKVGIFASGVATASLVMYLLHHRKFSNTSQRQKRSRRSRLHLVGAGPGDPELLTLAAVRALREADLIVTDVLVNQKVLHSFARRGAKILVANKTKGNAHEAQDELQQWTLDGLLEGLDVVRLKGGDPFLYGRGGEEVQFFTSHGFDVEVIPGLSSSMVGPMSMGIPVTTRGYADQFVVATLHGKRDTTPGVPAPFRPNRTVVFLMSVGRLNKLVEQLLQAGYPTDLDVSVAEKATTETQRNLHTTIGTLLEDAQTFNLQSPAVIAVGGTSGNKAGLPSNVEWSHGGVLFVADKNAFS